jgi:hypothetical protein
MKWILFTAIMFGGVVGVYGLFWTTRELRRTPFMAPAGVLLYGYSGSLVGLALSILVWTIATL